jgi:predicted amidophosphoribosyltransferase
MSGDNFVRCGVCFDPFTTFGQMHCRHPVCWQCQLQLPFAGNCPYCRRPLVLVCSRLIVCLRGFMYWGSTCYELFDQIAEAIMITKFGAALDVLDSSQNLE